MAVLVKLGRAHVRSQEVLTYQENICKILKYCFFGGMHDNVLQILSIFSAIYPIRTENNVIYNEVTL